MKIAWIRSQRGTEGALTGYLALRLMIVLMLLVGTAEMLVIGPTQLMVVLALALGAAGGLLGAWISTTIKLGPYAEGEEKLTWLAFSALGWAVGLPAFCLSYVLLGGPTNTVPVHDDPIQQVALVLRAAVIGVLIAEGTVGIGVLRAQGRRSSAPKDL